MAIAIGLAATFGFDLPPLYAVILAVPIAIIWACYLAWKDKAVQVVELEEKLRPRLRASCGVNVPQSIVPAQFNTGVNVKYFRLVLEADGATSVTNCSGCLREIRKDGKVRMGNETLYLKFAHGDNPPYESKKTILAGIPAQLDVVVTVENNSILLPTPQWIMPTSVGDSGKIFKEIGIYTLIVIVAGDGSSIQTELEFNWTGDWTTADLKLVKTSAVA